jgi:hypothetical protein
MFVSTAFYDGEQALTKIMTTDDEENESFVCRRKEMTKTVSYISHEGKQNGIQIPVPYNRPTPRWLPNPFDVQDRTNNKNQQRDDNLYSMNEQQQQRKSDPIQLYNSETTWTMAMMHHHWLVEYRRVWSTAFLAAAHDSMVAIRSGSLLFYLTVSPMIQFLYFILSYVICQKIIYEIIITILSPQLLRHLQWIVTYGIAWQLACTRRQLMMEVGLVVSFVGVYCSLRYLQKHQYLTRMKVRYEKSVQSIQKVRCLWLLKLL